MSIGCTVIEFITMLCMEIMKSGEDGFYAVTNIKICFFGMKKLFFFLGCGTMKYELNLKVIILGK